jgi:hypothetical protein
VSELLRLYAEAGEDGYPSAWHRCPTCSGSGWICCATEEGTSRSCRLCRGSCPSSDGCPSCTPLGRCGGEGSIKALVRAMAEDRCVRCGHPYQKGDGEWSRCDEQCTHDGPTRIRVYSSGENPPIVGSWIESVVEARWRILTVHHLATNSKLDCRWWNLAVLCQRCHLEIQGKVRMERRWLHEHSGWFKPYVAGFYAWTKLGEDLTRAEVDARLDELLALEDRQLEIGASA